MTLCTQKIVRVSSIPSKVYCNYTVTRLVHARIDALTEKFGESAVSSVQSDVLQTVAGEPATAKGSGRKGVDFVFYIYLIFLNLQECIWVKSYGRPYAAHPAV